jgi:cytochrome c oxidase subunit 3
MADEIVPLKQPRRPSEVRAFVGMVVFIGSWAMMFAGLFFAYALLRMKYTVWPPLGEGRLPLALPSLNTVILIATSAALALGLRAVRMARPRDLRRWLAVAIALGTLFVALQLVVWRDVWLSGIRPSSGIYGSIFYALTVFHGLHAVAGVIGLLVLVPGALRGSYTVQRHAPVRLWALYWHFVDVIWVVMFVTVYVL